MPWRNLAAWALAKSIDLPSTRELNIATPATAESGLALYVPGCGILVWRVASGVSFVDKKLMISARPATAPPGSPPANILANVERSGVTL